VPFSLTQKRPGFQASGMENAFFLFLHDIFSCNDYFSQLFVPFPGDIFVRSPTVTTGIACFPARPAIRDNGPLFRPDSQARTTHRMV